MVYTTSLSRTERLSLIWMQWLTSADSKTLLQQSPLVPSQFGCHLRMVELDNDQKTVMCCCAYLSLYYALVFTWPKAGREVGAQNWTQEHKSVWDGPTPKATGHAPWPAREWPVPKSASAQVCARTGTAGHCAVQRSWPVRTYSKLAILHRFSSFYTWRV